MVKKPTKTVPKTKAGHGKKAVTAATLIRKGLDPVEALNAAFFIMKEMSKTITQLEQNDKEAALYVESVILSRSRFFTGKKPYVSWEDLGRALWNDYDELDRLRKFREARSK